MTTKRVLSGVIAVAYIVAVYFSQGSRGAFAMAMCVAIPVALIWFSDAFGSATGRFGGTRVSNSSPGLLIAAGGWVLLLLPAALWVYWSLRGAS